MEWKKNISEILSGKNFPPGPSLYFEFVNYTVTTSESMTLGALLILIPVQTPTLTAVGPKSTTA